MSSVRLSLADSMKTVPADTWDALLNTQTGVDDPTGGANDTAGGADDTRTGAIHPFTSWAFLDALETSGSVGTGTGWAPRHLLAHDADGVLVGAMPMYLKGHSYGEYVFDHAWADALERAGGTYYPKLVTAIPFTPATGPRILSHCPETRNALIQGGIAAARQLGASSWHVLFPGDDDRQALDSHGLLARHDIQFIFTSPGYRDYADFLDALASRKRKALRKEREIAQANVKIELLTGSDITEAHWDVFFACYLDTGARKWGQPYLNREFFSLIGQRMADRILLVMASRDGRYIASALNFIGSDTLYGRYWGALDSHDSLHFELCYHQAIEYALAHGLTRVEAGAQGAHKLARGYRPHLVHSAHHIEHEGLRAAVARYLASERPAMIRECAAMDAESPFKAAP
ncbi:GNAT family N-acetyltransferase [Hyphomonadaceae bacterium BL14]|nr:GNAT family N-acetyltransferase [Hyphomonadaceae bacterium BL14]